MAQKSLPARDIVAGNVIFHGDEWWFVKNNYCHPNSCYAKMSLTNDALAKKYGRNAVYATCKTIGKNDLIIVMSESAVSKEMISKCFEEGNLLDGKLHELSNIFELPELVSVGGSALTVDRKVLEDICRKEIKASVERLRNYANKV